MAKKKGLLSKVIGVVKDIAGKGVVLCSRCNRPIKDPKYQKLGIGPTCMTK